MPTVSVIITTYNRPQLLERAVQSVLRQTYKDYEVIVVNDAGTIPKNFNDSRITYLNLSVNKGSSNAKNAGIKQAQGRYVVVLDDDNEFLPTFLEESVYMLSQTTPAVGACKVGRIIRQADYTDYAPPITHTGFDTIDWGVLMKREVFNMLQYDPEITGDEDADFGIQFAKHFKFTYIDKPLQIAYGDTEADSNCRPSPRRLRGLQRFLKKNWADYQQHPDELRYILRLAGRNFYKGGYRLKGIWYFWQSFMARKNFKTFLHFFFILFGWTVYNAFMDSQERKGAQLRTEGVL